MSIVYKTYAEIDRQQWDACIDASVNGLIYAKSFYLDAMSPGWQALVLNDYVAVMPLTSRKKWGISYLYQAPLIPQSGVFSSQVLPAAVIQQFLEMAASLFTFIEIPLNYCNRLDAKKGYKVKQRSNYVLDLQKRYEDIFPTFGSSAKKNLNRVKRFNLRYEQATGHRNIVDIYWESYGHRMQPFIKEDFDRLASLFDLLEAENKLVVRKVFKGDTMLAAMVLPFDGKRLYNLISYVSKEGREKEANYFMVDNLVKEFSGRPIVLDFEGSDVAGISKFYRLFSRQNENYPFVTINKLPFPLKLVKILRDKINRRK